MKLKRRGWSRCTSRGAGRLRPARCGLGRLALSCLVLGGLGFRFRGLQIYQASVASIRLSKLSRLMWADLVPEILRELRFWSAPTAGPNISLLILLALFAFICGCCAGALCCGLLLSQHLRQLASYLLRTLLLIFEGQVVAREPGRRLARRFSEYRE